MCGEKLPPVWQAQFILGSPPRVRGKVPVVGTAAGALRITPACAGKSGSGAAAGAAIGDHPRVCGEKCDAVKHQEYIQGSPPRVRGKVGKQNDSRIDRRITPACAGKRLKKAHKIKDFDPVPIRFHLVFRRFERWCSNLPTPDGNVPV